MKKKYIGILIILILFISLGYAALTSNLNIVGTSGINNASWNVHWSNLNVTNGSVTGAKVTTAAHILTGNTEVEYSITLSTPGEYYEFTVDAVNEGSIDAMIGSFSNKIYESDGTTEKQLPEYLDYSVTYDDDKPLDINQLLAANTTEKYKVRVSYKNDLDPDDLPSTTETLIFKFFATYVQKDENAVEVAHLTLYKVLQDSVGAGYANEYTGAHQDSMTGSGSKKIYYWYGSDNNTATAILDKWNVIFGGFCWQMIRTTDTGGVKMIYNGAPSEGACTNAGPSQQIGTYAFNTSNNSPAYVGYMYNPSTLITYKGNSAATSGSLFGADVTYSGGSYTLTGTSTTYDDNHHYTCNNTTGTCSTVRYYYYNNYYTELDDGRDVEEALEDMLSADDVNDTDSTLKATIDSWFQNNMTSYTSKLEDVIFCNDRKISSLGGWNPNGGSTSGELQFNNYNIGNDLSCTNITDKFSTSNAKAHLTYPTGLLTSSEANLLGNNTLRRAGPAHWVLSPRYYVNNANVRSVYSTGSDSFNSVSSTLGVRPVISIQPNTPYTGGDGSKNNPYVVE